MVHNSFSNERAVQRTLEAALMECGNTDMLREDEQSDTETFEKEFTFLLLANESGPLIPSPSHYSG